MAGHTYFGAHYWGPSYWGADVIGAIPPVYGDPRFMRSVLAPSHRIGTTPDEDNSQRIGGVPVSGVERRIGRAPR